MGQTYNFGEILLELREKNGLTQNQLAKRLGVTNSAISKYETSANPPPALMVRRIAAELGVSCDHMLGLEPAGTVSLYGLSPEQCGIITDLAELFRTRNISLRNRLSPEQYEMLGRITAELVKK